MSLADHALVQQILCHPRLVINSHAGHEYKHEVVIVNCAESGVYSNSRQSDYVMLYKHSLLA